MFVHNYVNNQNLKAKFANSKNVDERQECCEWQGSHKYHLYYTAALFQWVVRNHEDRMKNPILIQPYKFDDEYTEGKKAPSSHLDHVQQTFYFPQVQHRAESDSSLAIHQVDNRP